jgi:O-antigen/teichoic acid export membrane protein
MQINRASLAGLFANRLFRNSLNLMLSSGITSVFGFLFWIVVARSFDTAAVGLAGTLLSMSLLLSLLSMVGFDTIFMRFLGKSEQKNELLSGGLIGGSVASVVIATVFCLLLPLVSPELSFVTESIWTVAAFVGFTWLNTIVALTNAAFIAYRRTSFVLVVGIIFSVIKVGLPAFLTAGGPMAIFVIVGIAQIVNAVLNVWLLVRHLHFKPTLSLRVGVMAGKLRFGLAAYTSNILNLLPASLLPILVINNLGASSAGYFYIAFAIASLLYTIAFATNQVLLAEASHGEAPLGHYVRKGAKMISALMIPAIAILFFVCPFILGLFGDSYQDGATGILRVLCLNGVFVIANSLINFYFKSTKNLQAMLCMTATNAILTIVLAQLFIAPYGLLGVAVGSLLGSMLAMFVGCAFVLRAIQHTPLSLLRGMAK